MKHVQQPVKDLNNEKGFALITTLLVLSILTFIGLAGINTTSFELKIAGNERVANQRFYIADSGWKQSGPFLNALATPPDYVNVNPASVDYDYVWGDYEYIVRNFGDQTDFPADKDDLPTDAVDGSVSSVPYWYRIQHDDDWQAAGFGPEYRDFQYQVTCNAEGTTEVHTLIRKVYKVGY